MPGLLVRQAIDRHGGVDLLVNNVGGTTTPAGGFLALHDDAWQHTFDLTFMSAVRATRAALPSLLDRRGAVINISSVNARLPQPRLIAQSAAKAALMNLGTALAHQRGVPVAEVADRLSAMLGMTTGQFADPEEIAALVVFPASGQVPNMSGADLVIDGGLLKSV